MRDLQSDMCLSKQAIYNHQRFGDVLTCWCEFWKPAIDLFFFPIDKGPERKWCRDYHKIKSVKSLNLVPEAVFGIAMIWCRQKHGLNTA